MTRNCISFLVGVDIATPKHACQWCYIGKRRLENAIAAVDRQHDVTSVPFFIVNNAVTLSGAQAPETFIGAFK